MAQECAFEDNSPDHKSCFTDLCFTLWGGLRAHKLDSFGMLSTSSCKELQLPIQCMGLDWLQFVGEKEKSCNE